MKSPGAQPRLGFCARLGGDFPDPRIPKCQFTSQGDATLVTSVSRFLHDRKLGRWHTRDL
jgi:hypothetical protein